MAIGRHECSRAGQWMIYRCSNRRLFAGDVHLDGADAALECALCPCVLSMPNPIGPWWCRQPDRRLGNGTESGAAAEGDHNRSLGSAAEGVDRIGRAGNQFVIGDRIMGTQIDGGILDHTIAAAVRFLCSP